MSKYLGIATAVLFLACIFIGKWALNERDGRIKAESINESNQKEIVRLNNANTSATIQIQNLQKVKRSINEPCDCLNMPIPEPILDILRKRK